MELRLDRYSSMQPRLPNGYQLIAWTPRLLLDHAEVKFESFKEEIDAHVFACRGELDGGRNLMR